jgi:hypothetical protein
VSFDVLFVFVIAGPAAVCLCHRRCDNSQTETRISLVCKSDLQSSTRGLGRAGVWQKERARIWVPTTRRLKLLVQGILWTILILLWVQGSSFCGCGYGCGCGCGCVTTAPLSLPYDSTDYAGPVSPLLTLVVLPEAGFSLGGSGCFEAYFAGWLLLLPLADSCSVSVNVQVLFCQQ